MTTNKRKTQRHRNGGIALYKAQIITLLDFGSETPLCSLHVIIHSGLYVKSHIKSSIAGYIRYEAT